YLLLIDQNKDKLQNKALITENNRMVQFVEREVWEKWLKTNNRNFSEMTTFYGVRTHMGAQWAQIALGLSQLSVDASRRKSYIEFYKSYNKELRKNLKLVNQCYIWNSSWDNSGISALRARRATNRDPQTVQDVAHANQIIEYILMAHQ